MPPPTEPKPESTGEYYRKVSSGDPLAKKESIDPKDYKFILEDKPKKRFNFRLPNWPKPVLIAVGTFGAIVLLIIISSTLSGRGKEGYRKIGDIAAQQQEIIRVNKTIDQYTKDDNLKALAATINVTLTGSQTQIQSYLKSQKFKFEGKQLNARQNAEIDAELKNAALNNRFDAVYIDRLNKNMKEYTTSIQRIYPEVGPNGKKILDEANTEAKLLLTAPQLVNL